MSNSIRTYTAGRLVKATGRTRDATFSAFGGMMRSLYTSTFSLLQGKDVLGWAVGVDGYTARTLDTSAGTLLAQLSLNELVYACMRERMKVLITPAFLVERRQSDGTYQVDPDHPLTSLIRRPGPNIDTATLWRCLEASYASVGRLYLEPVYSNRGRLLAGLNPLNPAYVTERYEAGILTAYDWQPPDAPSVRFLPDELITRRAVDWADVPPLVAALGAVEADQVSNDFIRGFFSNAGIPSGIVKVRGSWNEGLTDAFRAKWMERFGSRGMNNGPAILDENIESYEPLGSNLSELDNETLRMFIETRICMCFGVPPLVIYAYAGLLKATYSNLSEAWASFWDATALPLLKEWAEWVNWSLLTQFESADDVLLGNVRCRFDPSGIGPFQEDVAAKVTQYQAGWNDGAVKLNEYRAVLGLPAEPAGDVYKTDRAPEEPAVLEMPARQEVQNG
jgi:HK97 family phage portal protein